MILDLEGNPHSHNSNTAVVGNSALEMTSDLLNTNVNKSYHLSQELETRVHTESCICVYVFYTNLQLHIKRELHKTLETCPSKQDALPTIKIAIGDPKNCERIIYCYLKNK